MIDIRYPIGFMFSLLGIVLTIYGFATIPNVEMYQKSFGINVNLWSGIVMLIFGISLLLFARRKKK